MRNLSRILIFALILSGFLSSSTIFMSCNSCSNSNPDDNLVDSDTIIMPTIEDIKGGIIGKLKQCSELVTTEISVRTFPTIIVDDGNINLNPATWDPDRYGTASVILPVDVTIKYGYDLEEMKVDVDKESDGSCIVRVYLPNVKIFDSSYVQDIPYNDMVIVKDKLAPRPTNGQISRGMQEEYHRVIKEFNGSLYADDIKKNTKLVFESILNNIDYKIKSVEILNLNDID